MAGVKLEIVFALGHFLFGIDLLYLKISLRKQIKGQMCNNFHLLYFKISHF